MHIHSLDGCAPAPLAHYLKALGVLRLVAEQADPAVRGWWDGERFFMATRNTIEEIERLFLHDYQPTPLVAPWNGGAGFYPKDKKARKAHDTIISRSAARFAPFTNAIKEAREFVANRKEAPDGLAKEEFIRACRNSWRGGPQTWLNAALVLEVEGKVRFPALLGTGGNDGRFDFSSNFLIRLLSVVDPDGTPKGEAKQLLQGALGGAATCGLLTGANGKVGQLLPGGAGGANSVNGAGDQNDTLLNPWDFVFMVEGAVLFASHASRRLGASVGSRAAAPFAVAAHAAGYASASNSDESARGEQWMPLWDQPMLLSEVQHLLAEGRTQVGMQAANEPLDMARAIARLGVARGIAAFQRFGYVERNGQSNLAVPLGRFVVSSRVSPHIDCLDDLGAWLPRLRRLAADSDGTGRLRSASQQVGDFAFDVTQHSTEPVRWLLLLLALGDVEAVMRTGSGFKGPARAAAAA